MNEDLVIKLKVDTSSVTTTVNRLKNDIANVNKTIGNTSSATNTTKAVQSNEKLAKTMDKIEQSVANIKQGISGWDIAKTVTGAKAMSTAFDKVKSSVSDLKKKIQDMTGGHLSNAMDAINPFSKMYKEDVEWTGFSDGLGVAKDELKNFFDATKSEVSVIGQRLGKAFGNIKGAKSFKELIAGVKGLGGAFSGAASGGGLLATTLGVLKAAALAAATAISGLFLAITGIGAVAGVAAAFSVSKLGNEIFYTAQRFNMSAQSFQEWSYIMQQTGSDVEDLKGFLETLASEQAAVIEGSADAAANFKRLGMSVEEVVGSSQQELFEKTVKNIQNIEDATQRSAIAYSIFGDEASRIMNVLNMSNADLERARNNYALLGGTMSGELLESSTRLQNSINNMKQAWQGISNTLAEIFIPIVQAVVQWLTKAFVVINLFIRTVAGLDLNPKGGMDKATSSNKAYTSSVGAATKAVEKLKRTTMGFDELNIVQNPNDSSAAAAGAGAMPNMGSMGAAFDTSFLDAGSLNLAGIYAWFEEYKTLIQDITTWTLILGGIVAIGFAFGTGNVLLGIAGAAALGLGIVIGNSEGGSFDRIQAWFEQYKTLIQDITTWTLVLGGIIAVAIAFATGNLVLGLAGLAALGLGIGIGMGEGGTWERVGAAISQFCQNVWDTIVNAIKGIGAFLATIGQWIYDNVIQPVWNFIEPAVMGIAKLIEGYINGVKNIFSGAMNIIKGIFTGDMDLIKAGVSQTWEGIKQVIGAIAGWVNDWVIKPVLNFFAPMWTALLDGAKKAWEGIKNAFAPVATWFKDTFTKAWTGVKNVFSTGGKIFSGIKEGIENTFKTVVNGIIGGINKIVAAPFNTINGMLNKIRDISFLDISPFKSLWSYNPLTVPQIPLLAKGGIATSPTVAMFGEAGKEAVLPLENNTGWMDELADRIAARNQTPSKLVLQVGEKELGWVTINSINSITKEMGGLQLAL